MDDHLKNVWPEWLIEEPAIGRGSYGVVYKAVKRERDLESYAAVKVISIPRDESEYDTLIAEGLTADNSKSAIDKIVNGFVNEIKLMEAFKGVQNIVSVEDYKVCEKAQGVGYDIYIRMELLS
ncbi:MAG: serine/threonine protein kinase, partial [Oscillospiraceae bacterium]|nr:serine/threonine protein kinase [Oscillospiraceae bacterium]